VLAGSAGSLRGQLVRKGLGSLATKSAGSLIGLALAIFLARFLGPDGYGVYSYVFAIVMIVSVFAQVGTPVLMVREVAASDARQEWGRLRGHLLRQIQVVIGVCAVLLLVGFAALSFLGGEMDPRKREVASAALLVFPFIALSGVIGAGLRGLTHVVRGQLPDLVLRPALFLALSAVLLGWIPALREPMVAMVLHGVAGAIVLVYSARALNSAIPSAARSAVIQFDIRVWVRSAIPLSAIAGLVVVNGQLDLLVLGVFAPAKDVGVYRVAVQASMLVTFGLQAMNMVVAPYYARFYASADGRAMQRLATMSSRVVLVFALPVCVVFVVFGDVLLAFVFGEEFRAARIPLAILAIGQLFNAATGSVGYLLNMSRLEGHTARALFVATLVNLVVGLLLVPQLGMLGAAIGSAASVIVWNTLLYRTVIVKLGIKSSFIGI
jgi:O-antigen/teichoic acid export membrane protein